MDVAAFDGSDRFQSAQGRLGRSQGLKAFKVGDFVAGCFLVVSVSTVANKRHGG